MSVIVSVRIDEEDLDAIEQMGFKAGPLMRNLLKKEIQRMRSKSSLKWLEDNSIKAKSDLTEMVRKDRDSR